MRTSSVAHWKFVNGVTIIKKLFVGVEQLFNIMELISVVDELRSLHLLQEDDKPRRVSPVLELGSLALMVNRWCSELLSMLNTWISTSLDIHNSLLLYFHKERYIILGLLKIEDNDHFITFIELYLQKRVKLYFLFDSHDTVWLPQQMLSTSCDDFSSWKRKVFGCNFLIRLTQK